MGVCTCVDNPSPLNPGNTAVIDIANHNDNIIKVQNAPHPPIEEPNPIEKNHVKKVINIAAKNKSNSTLQNAKTQCSSMNHDVLLNELKVTKNNNINNNNNNNNNNNEEMLKEEETKKERTTQIKKGILQKVKYKSNKEHIDFNNVNIVIFGDKHTGKSAFVIKYVDNFFEKLYIPSISIERHSKKVKYGRMVLKFTFWVTPGDSGYQIDYESVLSDADFILVFYDTSVNGSFDVAKKYCANELSNHQKEYSGISRNVIFIGNKTDIVPRKEPKDKIEKYCTENMFKFFEISVKNAAGIKDVMQFIVMTHLKLIEVRDI